MERQRRFTGTFRAIDLDHTALGIPATQGKVEREGTGGDGFDPHPGGISKTHDRSLAEVALDLPEHKIERLIALTWADISAGGLRGFHVGWHG